MMGRRALLIELINQVSALRVEIRRLSSKLDMVLTGGSKVMATVQDLDTAVADLTAAVDDAVKAISNVGTGINPADLDHVHADIKAQADRLNKAVADAVAKAHAAGM